MTEARIGVLGGTFDPPHTAHVALANLFTEELKLSELVLLPAGNPWQKPAVRTAAGDRVAMLEMAFAGFSGAIRIDTREIRRAGPTYTVETLGEFRREVGDKVSLTFLMGADQMVALPGWHQWRTLFDLANLAAAGRPGIALDPLAWPREFREELDGRIVAPENLMTTHGSVVLVPADLGDVSSSRVRTLLKEQDNPAVTDLVPSTVLDFIRRRGLYKY
jgi:nicotinate-nucleotide adenylyltransferase